MDKSLPDGITNGNAKKEPRGKPDGDEIRKMLGLDETPSSELEVAVFEEDGRVRVRLDPETGAFSLSADEAKALGASLINHARDAE